ncbi:inositol monophosphatase family protein [Micromonospora sp. WMMD1082]|uniref:inositol monophosphatase family protein n=1 Tax=Micromonospora sp. WMMD1082 TaxID=3016104 RepID=UPI002416D569|nr:inositol monophosphatase family protein [Micromonospora sp. WMMD1082]MDG4792951.1 inositol monophosphatase family protein [Micromonospora sp. WMMD1082]
MSSYKEHLPIAVEATRRAAEAMRQQSPGALASKGDRDVVSELDYAIERDLRAFLSTETPDIGFHGEEEGPSGSSSKRWVLDPIDGTSNYVRGLPLCAVSLALVQGNEAVVGVIELPFLSATYTAAKGWGAHANGQRITVSNTTCLSQALVAVGDYAVGPDAETRNQLRLALTGQLAAEVQRIRMTGSAALDLAWLAHGKLDAALTLSNHPWDMASGVIIAREAGAVVIDGHGARHDMTSTTTLAITPELTDPILAAYQKAITIVADAR